MITVQKRSLRLAFVAANILSSLAAQSPRDQFVTLPGHVVPALSQASRLSRTPLMDQDPLTFSVMLNLSDQAAYNAFRQDFNNPDSPNYHKTISGNQFTSRFGPSPEAYSAVLNYFQQQGFSLVVGSTNRRTLTFHGSRVQAESAFNLKIDNYQMGTHTFHAIASDPALPAELAPLVAGVSGLSSLGHWEPAASAPNPTPAGIAKGYGGALTPAGSTNSGGLPPGLDGSGQTIGILSFYNYSKSDISNWLATAGLPASLINNVSTYTVGIGSPFADNVETVLDIDAALGVAQGAKIVVYIAPYYSGEEASDFYTPISIAGDNMWSTGGVISASYGVCEPGISASDAANMDALLETYAAVGVTLFAATGDTGTTCSVGGTPYPNSVWYPADVPHAIAVGGTSLSVNSDGSYNSEFWWDGASGSGGYGVSKFFSEPGYQVPFYSGAGGRSIPDVAMDADPASGIVVCLGTTSKGVPICNGGIGGTSLATPLWAGIWAIANQANVDAVGYTFSPVGDYFYKIPGAFHAASTIVAGNFADVGLGSPIIPSIIAKGIPPVINSFSPTTGSASGGTTVTITGVGFIGVEKVTFGGVAGTHLSIESDSRLTVETPVAAAEPADIEVITPGGTAKASAFAYVPQISLVNPNQSPLDGGITITVSGLALSDSLVFNFGGGVATSVRCSSSTSCTMVAPAHAAGTVDIIAETPWGYGNSAANSHDQFTYQAPSITSFTPSAGPTTGGALVTVTGVGLQDGKTTISFGGVAGTSVSCSGSTSCYVTSPAHAAGPVYLTATVGGTTSAPSSSAFTYAVYPTIISISQDSIPPGTTAKLTIMGTGFSTTAGKTVFSYGTSGGVLSGVSCSSTTQCTASFTAPPIYDGKGTTTSVLVVVTVNGLTSFDSVGLSYLIPFTLPTCKGTTCF